MKVIIAGPSNLGPYHLARYNRLAEEGLEVHVAACPIAEHHRPWRFDASRARFRVTHPFGEQGRQGALGLLAAARAFVDEVRPEAVVIIGYGSRYLWAMARAARERGLPAILMLIGGRSRHRHAPHREVVKHVVCRALYDAALVPGMRAASYAEHLGIAPDRIWRVGNVVDNDHFARGAEGVGQDEPPAFLYVGRLSDEKNLAGLMDAWAAYRQAGGTWSLRIAGTGPREDAVAGHARRVGAEMLGWIGYDDLPATLARASAFVLPSVHEPWGLVVNEAMAAGLPVLVSRHCGCYPELCREGVDGFGFDPTSRESLARALTRMASVPADERASMAAASRAVVDTFTLDQWVLGVSTCLRAEAAGGAR